MLFKIMDYRTYYSAKQAYDSEKDPTKRPKGPAIDRVSKMVFELAEEEMTRRKREAGIE